MTVRVPNLGSRVLALTRRRLVADGMVVHGHPVVLAETFVDAQLAGTVYAAARWEQVETTRGGFWGSSRPRADSSAGSVARGSLAHRREEWGAPAAPADKGHQGPSFMTPSVRSGPPGPASGEP